MHIYPIPHSITQVLDGDTIRALPIGIRNFSQKAANNYLMNCRRALADAGLSHITIQAKDYECSECLVISGHYVCWIAPFIPGVNKNLGSTILYKWIQAHRKWVGPVMNWCKKNCQQDYKIISEGMKLSLVDDYILFKLQFEGTEIFPKLP